MSKQNDRTIGLLVVLLVTIFAIGMYQQALASDYCDASTCYNYPLQKDPSGQVLLSQNVKSDITATLSGL
jgi:hypothetical protein